MIKKLFLLCSICLLTVCAFAKPKNQGNSDFFELRDNASFWKLDSSVTKSDAENLMKSFKKSSDSTDSRIMYNQPKIDGFKFESVVLEFVDSHGLKNSETSDKKETIGAIELWFEDIEEGRNFVEKLGNHYEYNSLSGSFKSKNGDEIKQYLMGGKFWVKYNFGGKR